MPDLVNPSEIPWEFLKGRTLEEALYWLIDDMGGRDLTWRLGGTGGGASDGGRDLEARFYNAQPDGELVPQTWWIEAKGRTGTVESSAVTEAVNRATAFDDVDVFVIVTNTQFSNPTRDWIAEWQGSHRRPVIRLWERNDLERLFSRHPSACLRVFSRALTTGGRQLAVVENFWQRSRYISRRVLHELFDDFNELEWDSHKLLPMIASEVTNGDLRSRPWAYLVPPRESLVLLIYGIANAIYFMLRCDDAGREYGPYREALAYLVITALDRNGASAAHEAMEDAWRLAPAEVPDEIRQRVMVPIVATAIDQLRDACASDCTRVSSDLVILREEDVTSFWSRFEEPSGEQEENHRRSKEILAIEGVESPCKVGFRLGKDRSCPLLIGHEEESWEGLVNMLPSLERIVAFRKSESRSG